MKRLILLSAFTMLLACKDKQPVVQQPVAPTAQRPAWVASRPVSDGYYIGIGLATVRGGQDHQETAKKNALNDLASEISVKVEGNSLLYTLDRKTSFDESFTSTVNTRTSEQLEGYELVDTWENGTEYWTYYRLSKAEHARIKAERKRQAVQQAADLYARAQQSLATGDLRSAFDKDLRALLAMKAYWGENDTATVNGRSVSLANELYNDMQRLMAGTRITALPERCVLEHGNRFSREMLLRAQFVQGTAARDLAQLPLVLSYPGIAGKVTELRGTDAEGQVRTTVQKVDLAVAGPALLARLDMEALVPKDVDQAFAKPLVASLNAPELRVPIDVKLPKVHMTVMERNMGEPLAEGGAALTIKQELATRGFRFVEREQDADLLMTITASTREGGEGNGFHTAFLDLAIACRDRRSQDVVYTGGKQGIKGVQLNYPKAGMEAYKKAGQDIRQEVVPALLNAIL